jgi:uncharacterized membrane protein HdeD (DUF308 family)
MKNIWEGIISDAKYIRDHELQPKWYKIFKTFLVLVGAYAFFQVFGGRKTLVFLGCFFTLGLVLHLVYRINTRQFTQTWLDFVIEDVDGELKTKPIGIYYYLAILVNLILSFLASYYFVN